MWIEIVIIHDDGTREILDRSKGNKCWWCWKWVDGGVRFCTDECRAGYLRHKRSQYNRDYSRRKRGDNEALPDSGGE